MLIVDDQAYAGNTMGYISEGVSFQAQLVVSILIIEDILKGKFFACSAHAAVGRFVRHRRTHSLKNFLASASLVKGKM